jgi:hypothetical protein
MKRCSGWLFCLAITCVLAGTGVGWAAEATASEAVLLRFGGSAGDTMQYKTSMAGRAQASGEGLEEPVRSELVVQMDCTLEYVEASADALTLLGRVTSGNAKLSAADEEHEREFEQLAARYRMTRRGELTSYELESGELMVVPFAGGAVVPGPEDAFVLSGAGVLPEKPVKENDTWSGTAQVPSPFGDEPMELQYESTYLGRGEHRGIPCHRIRTSFWLEHEESDEAEGAGGLSMSSRMVSEVTWLLDAERGVILLSDATSQMAVSYTAVSPDGEEIGFKEAGVLNTRSVLTELNGRNIGD